MKETYRAYNSRDELDRAFRVRQWFQGRISSDFLLSSFHQGFSYRSGGRELVCATVKNRRKFASQTPSIQELDQPKKILYTWASKISQHSGSSLKTNVPQSNCNVFDMQILCKRNTLNIAKCSSYLQGLFPSKIRTYLRT